MSETPKLRRNLSGKVHTYVCVYVRMCVGMYVHAYMCEDGTTCSAWCHVLW